MLLQDDSEYTYFYYAWFTTSSSETVEAEEVVTNSTNAGLSMTSSANNNSLYINSSKLDSYVELNEDLYLWVAEKATGMDAKLVVSGEKIDKPDYPQYNELFYYTFLSMDNTQIVFGVPWGNETERKFEVKIGKISDTTILKN